LFTLVLNTITASWESAVSSACVRSEVRVGRSSIALLISFNNSITAFGSDFKEVDGSSVSCLQAACIVGDDSSELGQLAGRNWNWVGKDKPISVFITVSSGEGTWVLEGSWSSWKKSTGVDGDIEPNGLSAQVGHARWAASVNNGQGVSSSLVAKLTIQMIDNTITAFGKSAIGSASVGASNV